MGYKLAAFSGDSLMVPQQVVANLPRAEGDAVRVALYILASGCTDGKTIAHDLGLKSVSAAENAMLWWAGVGLLEKEKPATAAAPAAPQKTSDQKAAEIDLATLDDPFVAVLCEEAQTAFGKALGRHELQRLVALYLAEGWQPDVVLLCCAEMGRQGRRTVGAVTRELAKWRDAGVETGEDAERYLKREQQRDAWQTEVAGLFQIPANQLTQWERRAITRWQEEWHYTANMVEEALLHAENHRTVRYLDGILRSWHAQGLTTVQAVRGKGALTGSNILATGKAPAKPMQDMFHQNWNALFDEDTEG
ncbi:MAG: DnaD domain protein [Gemmiger sp.]|nr:DnaD domain protein [Gemmiger sp.]